LNEDFLDMLSALSEAGVEFLVVGAHALAFHGHVRATGDLDIWVRPTAENASRVWAAILRYGAPHRHMTLEDFHTPDVVFQVGVAPNRIDVITSISGVEFESAWANRKKVAVDEVAFFVIGRSDLLQNKRASGRPKDLADVAWLEQDSKD
jgi:hypothetical protein